MSELSPGSGFTYHAFISYSHRDKAWADWLHRSLEAYRVPLRLVGKQTEHGIIPRRLNPVFRDCEELASASELGPRVNEALGQSKSLIVICSPASAASRWVNEEVLSYKRMGRGERIFCLIVAGEPNATDLPGRAAEECFCPALRCQLGASGQPTSERTEPIAADARVAKDGKPNARLKLIAGMLDVGFDTLKQREQHRKIRRMAVVTVMAVTVMALTAVLAAFALVSRHDAVIAQQTAERRQGQAEDILGFMLGDLRKKLATVGRLDLMVAVDDKATAYFKSLTTRDIDTRGLEQQARLLTGIGQVRMDQGDANSAMAAFSEAYVRSRELNRREPGSGQRLFDLAQTEYWIGFVYWRQGHLDHADTWLRRYRESAVRLAAMDKSNFAWQREVAYGDEDLATLDMARGKDQQAEQAFRATYELYLRWMKARPHDTGLRGEAANIASYLGSLAMKVGRLSEARARFTEQVDDLSANRTAEPENAQWQSEWPDAHLLLAQAQTETGDVSAARHGIAEATDVALNLTRQDPTNRTWQLQLGKDYWWQARLDGRAEPARGSTEARQAEKIFTAVQALDPEDSFVLHWLAKAHLLLAELAWRAGDNREASNWLSRADTELPSAMAKPQDGDNYRLLQAHLHVLQGNVAAQRGDAATAQAAWSVATRALREGDGPPAFDHLDLLARVLLAQHQGAAAAPYLARLKLSGYVPLYPWRNLSSGTPTGDAN